MDSEYTNVRCPNGHDLQAARMHLSMQLTCPVCGISFVPQPSHTALPVAPPDSPQTLTYGTASQQWQPVQYPGVTSWMVWLWLIVGGVQFLSQVVVTLIGPAMPTNPQQVSGVLIGIVAAASIVSCFVWVAMVTAFVLQLFWIYRIHKDAKRAGHYNEISPGLALGISFIPLIHNIWTGWTMRKLSSFSLRTGGREAEAIPGAMAKSESATRNFLWYSVIFLVVQGISFVVFLATMWGPMMRMMQAGAGTNPMQFQQQLQQQVTGLWQTLMQLGMQVGQLLLIVLFVLAVRKLEAALYPTLGAPPKQ